MSDRYVEKIFLYAVAASILCHIAIFYLMLQLPEKKPVFRQEPLMVDLSDMPELKVPLSSEKKEAKRGSDRTQHVERESVPRGERDRDRVALPPRPTTPPAASSPKRAAGPGPRVPVERPPAAAPGNGDAAMREPQRNPELFKPKTRTQPYDVARLFPSAQRLASLEESYRKKYEPEVTEGDAKFLNTQDIQFGSFLRRFETAVYGVWRYPQDAARMGIEGVTAVKITFNRRGEVENIQLLESSGSKILDDEVFRSLRALGPVGGFPRGYEKETFNLIAFFQYGIIRGVSRGALH
ncbi:MAG: energy transducer TonB [Geobacter sp.]|nr:energy transducer TonB [Geobacter sp.]